MSIIEKAAYIKGLSDGLCLNKDTAEGKLIAELISLVGEMSTELQRLNDYIEEIDECLGDVEDFLADELDDDCDCDCDDCDCDCDDCDCCDEYYEAECPACGKTFRLEFDEDDIDAPIECPHCNAQLKFDEGEIGDAE